MQRNGVSESAEEDGCFLIHGVEQLDSFRYYIDEIRMIHLFDDARFHMKKNKKTFLMMASSVAIVVAAASSSSSFDELDSEGDSPRGSSK
ncbi:hypothetical protein ACMD2_06788, partial [Ananas comosus]